MSIPEWVIVILASVVCAVISWGIKRLVKANDDTSLAIVKIGESFAQINGRLIASETWQNSHEKQDDERHRELIKSTESIWDMVRS